MSSSSELVAKLAEFKKSLGSAGTEVASLKKKMDGTNTKKTNSDKRFVQVRRTSERSMLRSSVALSGRNEAEKLTFLPLTVSVNTANAAVQ